MPIRIRKVNGKSTLPDPNCDFAVRLYLYRTGETESSKFNKMVKFTTPEGEKAQIKLGYLLIILLMVQGFQTTFKKIDYPLTLAESYPRRIQIYDNPKEEPYFSIVVGIKGKIKIKEYLSGSSVFKFTIGEEIVKRQLPLFLIKAYDTEKEESPVYDYDHVNNGPSKEKSAFGFVGMDYDIQESRILYTVATSQDVLNYANELNQSVQKEEINLDSDKDSEEFTEARLNELEKLVKVLADDQGGEGDDQAGKPAVNPKSALAAPLNSAAAAPVNPWLPDKSQGSTNPKKGGK